ncbi:MAG: hypothetical protein JXA52_00165 [Planctomycetes bacterium]|nr:hypothetical protein [Planctomycetota bacterium]
MNPIVLAANATTKLGVAPLGFLVMFVYVGVFVLIVSFLIRAVKYFKTAGDEQRKTRLELGKIADEVQQLRQELKTIKETKFAEE